MSRTITPTEFAEICKNGPIELIDVRTPAEFEEVHVRGARNVPLDRLDPSAFADKEKSIYVICRSGGRGKKACDQLHASGNLLVCNVEGGTLACEQAGLPLVRGRKIMSLERQVRIAAGGIAFIGALLALLVDPLFAGIPAFIGAGLVFAGITDTCGMGMLIARMPWNQRSSSPSTCSVSDPAK